MTDVVIEFQCTKSSFSGVPECTKPNELVFFSVKLAVPSQTLLPPLPCTTKKKK